MFSVGFAEARSGEMRIFEVSSRKNQCAEFASFIYQLRDAKARMFGYNNEGFDYVVVHHLITLFERQGFFTSLDAYDKAQEIIDPKAHAAVRMLISTGMAGSLEYAWQTYHKYTLSYFPAEVQQAYATAETNNRFRLTIWPDQRIVTQGDLLKIHHFDNVAKSTSLKKLEINMRSQNVIDLPYSPHTPLTSPQADEVIAYMCHDVSETLKFYKASIDQIRFRDDLAIRFPDLGDVLNFNDTKIGKKYFERELEKSGVPCYEYVGRKKSPRQTLRPTIALSDVISSKVQFAAPEFQTILDRLRGSIIVETKGVFDDMVANFDGLDFVFGTGGLHGSLSATSVYPDATYDLVDVDVASYYPNLAISNGFYPEHLSDKFCDIYRQVYEMRKQYGKKTAENAMLKLALNGVYGNSGNAYSPFYDTKYMMSITINGQLFLCMLAEWVVTTCGAKMVQVNTDGITCLVPRVNREKFNTICHAWENHTGLDLEHTEYTAMHLRDVNSYMAVKKDGSVKRIGAYAYEHPIENPFTRELAWYKNHSMRVVAKAAEAKLVHGVDIADFIKSHRDHFDFMLSVKVPRSSRLEERWPGVQIRRVQNTTRYYVSTAGCALTKVMPPLAGKVAERPIGIEKGWTVKVVNDAAQFDWRDVNWLYYIEAAKKLTAWVT